VLVFVAPAAAHTLTQTSTLVAAILTFAAFCAAASGIYVVNDLLDLEADRIHPRKRKRPFASTSLPLRFGLIGPVLVLVGLMLAIAVSPAAAAIVGLYAVLSLTYSLVLKTKPLVDVFALAALYSLRLFAGAVATRVPASIWLLGFSSFTFLALALLKRLSEPMRSRSEQHEPSSRRGYFEADKSLLQIMGVASTFVSAVILSLYVSSDAARAHYPAPDALWLLVPLLLFWQCRLWLASGRGHMHDDPLVYAFRDWVTWLVALACGLVMMLAVRGVSIPGLAIVLP
jgi:4-hydroxybenzoate polyprenyltransferase